MNEVSSKEWLINELETLIKKFPEASVRYEYIDEIKGHFVEVLPSNVPSSDKYLDVEEKLYFDFVSRYPNEGLSFQTADAVVPLNNNNICFQKDGRLYSNILMQVNINQTECNGDIPNVISIPEILNEISSIGAYKTTVNKHIDFENLNMAFQSDNNLYSFNQQIAA